MRSHRAAGGAQHPAAHHRQRGVVRRPDGTGDIALRLEGDVRVAYLGSGPTHVRGGCGIPSRCSARFPTSTRGRVLREALLAQMAVAAGASSRAAHSVRARGGGGGGVSYVHIEEERRRRSRVAVPGPLLRPARSSR
jgi:hypothetical protein